MKGPLTVVDIISMHMGWGWGGYGVGPLKFAHQLRKRMPAFYQPDEYGVPDVVQRLHWDPERAQALGIPAPYDYGQMRAAWVSHLLTNWIGDDGWLAEMDLQLRGFNYHGDIHRCTGAVTAKGDGAHRRGVAGGVRHQPARRGDHQGHREGAVAVKRDRCGGAAGPRRILRRRGLRWFPGCQEESARRCADFTESEDVKHEETRSGAGARGVPRDGPAVHRA